MESLIIELRPQLRSGYVHILLQPNTQIDNVKISKDCNPMAVKITEKELELNLLPIEVKSSISSLQFLNPWIVFRIQLSQSLDLANNEQPETLATSIDLPPVHKKLLLTCYNCKNSIANNEVSFERVLSLPSEECEPSEWFCCSHSNVDYKDILCPRTSDCFYGSHFYLLNTEILTSKLVTNDKDVICNYCLSVLGIVKDDSSHKIWSHCLKFTSTEDSTSKSQEKLPLDDFKLALKEFVKNGNLFKEVYYFAEEKDKKVSLLIKIMDKNLSMLTQSSAEASEVSLKKQCVIKVLYKFAENEAEDLKDNSNRSTYRLSLSSIHAAVDYLTTSSQKLPPIYRSTDSYFIGYIS